MSTIEDSSRGDRWAATQSAWAHLLLDGFAGAGVRDVIISPGSRSTPFVLAAHRHPELRCRDILDERSAGFFALGQGKASGEPSLLICTSGTAGAHYLPAVMEASLSHTPLLVLTADRPFELQECGANQTVDQLKLYGAHVRRFLHLGLPDSSERALRALRRRVRRIPGRFTSTRPPASRSSLPRTMVQAKEWNGATSWRDVTPGSVASP
jgi:2-succinyl-5-enolpyruvyl-6-hydroxy-3-cyclohexene-1-carboxylate synthase